jgi:Skp family chaperone for outer membrane proteins
MVSACFRLPARSGFTPLLFLLTVTRAIAADSVETVQQAAAEWAKLRSETVRLQTDWQWQREALEASLTALRARAAKLVEDRDTLQAEIARESAKSVTLVAQNNNARQGMQTVEERMQQLTQQLVAVRPFLPPRLAEGLELAFKSIEDAKLGPAERMQHVVTIFNRCGAFNKSITFAEQELALEGAANPRLLEVLYFGLSHAYAYDRTNRIAYFGHPEKQGWAWQPRPEAAGPVAQMIAIYHEKSDPTYIIVPAEVSEPFTAASAR